MTSSEPDRPIRVLYLLTDEISAVLVRGQLGFLRQHGFDVTVGTHLADPGRPKQGAWDEGVHVEHVDFAREPSPFRDLRALWSTVRLIRRQQPAIVNASTPKAGLVGMLAAWLCRVPVRCYTVRGLRFETASGVPRRLFATLERLTMRCANHVVFNGPSLQALAEREGLLAPGTGDVIASGSGNGIDTERFDPATLPTRDAAREQFGVPADARVIGFVGRFTNDKGIADLVTATEHLRTELPDLHLLLVGQFEQGDPIDSGTRSTIEAADWIATVPWIDHTGVAYRAMDVLAFPSYREGLPNVPLEAQRCGVPVVGYAATGTVDAVRNGHTGLLVSAGDQQALGSALGELLADPDRRVDFGSAGASWVAATFDRDALWQGWVDRYREWSA